MAKRNSLSASSSMTHTPQNGKASTSKTKTPQSQTMEKKTPPSKASKSPASNLRQNQNMALKSPNGTPNRKQSTPKESKGTLKRKRTVPNDSDIEESVDDEIEFNFKRFKSMKFEKDDDEDKAPFNNARTNVLLEEDKSDQRDEKSLFLKNFPAKYTVTQIKALSKDIIDVRFRVFKRLGKGSEEKHQDLRCAFLDFESESKAEMNYNKLKGKKIDNKEIYVDYVGAKSTHRSAKESQNIGYDKKKLYVAGLPQEVTKTDLEGLFPNSVEIFIPKTKRRQQLFGYAFINFENEADCQIAHDATQNKILKGSQLVVLYSSSKSLRKQNEESEEKNEMKGDDEENESEDDEDDDNDDDDDDSEDEDMDDDDASDEDNNDSEDDDDSEDEDDGDKDDSEDDDNESEDDDEE